jgi:hypothetical protein
MRQACAARARPGIPPNPFVLTRAAPPPHHAGMEPQIFRARRAASHSASRPGAIKALLEALFWSEAPTWIFILTVCAAMIIMIIAGLSCVFGSP